MNTPHRLLDSILGAFVPVHADGFKFVAGAALATLILFALAPALGWLGALATIESSAPAARPSEPPRSRVAAG